MEGGNNSNNNKEPVRLTIQCSNRPRNDSMSTCSSTPLSPWSTNSSSSSFFPSSSSACNSSLSPMSTSPPSSPMPRTPIPIDSPLFNNVPGESRRKRYKSFSRDIARRARSQKAKRDDSVKKETPTQELKKGDSATFLVRKHKYGKPGWKLMPEDEHFNFKINGHILEQAVQTVRHMLYVGHDIPEKLSLVIQ